MFRKILIVTAATAALGGLAAPAMAATTPESRGAHTASASLVGTSIHSNLVTIYPADDESPLYDGLSFTPSGPYDITSGQPWGGVTTATGAFGSLQITAQAGRHDSSGPAAFFTSNASALVGGDSYSNTPSELNFAFTGTLSVNGNDYPLVVGQGSNDVSNNWWFGGQGWTQDDPNQMTSPDGRYTLISGTSQETFSLVANS